MAGLPHYRNSRAAMQKFEPLYKAQFEVLLTPPPAVAGGWTLVMENVLKIGGLEVNKQPDVVTQKYKSATRTFAGGAITDTSIKITMDFEVNLDDSNSAYVYKALRKWCDLIYDPLTGRMGLKKDYVGGPLIINFFNKAGDIFRQIKAPVVFPNTPLKGVGEDADFTANDIYQIQGFGLVADYWEETIL
jgi:hypothetical protein